MSRRTVGFHLVHMARQSCPMSSSATSAAGKKNEGPVQPGAPTPATRHVPQILPGQQFLGAWPSSFQGSLWGVHWRRVLTARPFAFMGVLLMFLRRRVSGLVGDSQVSASHVHLSGRTWLKSVITSPSIPINLKMTTEFLLAEKHGFIHKFFLQQWLYPSEDQAWFSLNIAMVPIWSVITHKAES